MRLTSAILAVLLLPPLPRAESRDLLRDPERPSAVDLSHGAGSRRMAVRRSWAGRETLHTHFGPGWCDANLVRLTLLDSDSLLIWRGGMGWRCAFRKGGLFALADGGTVVRSAEGWTLRDAGGVLEFDGRGRLTVENERRFQYDDEDRLLSVETSAQNVLRYRYRGNRVSRVDGPEGLTAEYEYDAEERLAAVMRADKRRVEYRYDSAGALVAAPAEPTREEREEPPSSSRDTFGRIATVTHPDDRTTRFEYNALDLPVRIDHADGRTEELDYDEHGLLTRRKMSDGSWEEFESDRDGRLVSVRDSGAPATRVSYDGEGRIREIARSDGRKVEYAYDASGNVAETVDESGLRTRYAYDEKGRLSESQDPVHGKRRIRYSDSGYSIEREELGRWTVESVLGKPSVVVRPSGRRVQCQYDARGRFAGTILPSGLAWNCRYDGSDRLAEVEGPDGARTLYSYDSAGRVTSVVRAGVAWRHYRYDRWGRLERISSANGIAAEYRYDGKGRVESALFPEGEVRYGYDARGAATSIEGPGWRIEQSFHPDGGLAGRRYKPCGLDLKIPRDKSGRAGGIELNGIKAAYEYGSDGRLERIRLPGNLEIKIYWDEAGRPVAFDFAKTLSVDVVYDRADRITMLSAVDGNDQVLFSEQTDYDPDGNVVRIQETDGKERKLEYDDEDRLVKASRVGGSVAFQYDLGGNLVSRTTERSTSRWELDAAGRPARLGELLYTWDAAGNMVAGKGGGIDVENRFDAAGRLRERVNGDSRWRYGYLPDGDRLCEDGIRGRVWFAYLPEGLVGLKDEAGVVWLVVSLPGTDWPLALCGSNGKTLFVVADRQRSIRRLYDPSGALTAGVDFGPYGAIEASDGTAPVWIYAGMVWDESGLMYARKRYYLPGIGRFLSIDPEFGDPADPATCHPYAFARSNPYRYRDPSGTSPQETPAELWEAWRALKPEGPKHLVELWRRAGGNILYRNFAKAKDLMEAVREGASVAPRATPRVVPPAPPFSVGTGLGTGIVGIAASAAYFLVERERHRAERAEAEYDRAAEEQARWLRETLAQSLRDHPDRFRFANGQSPDPNKPDDLERMVRVVHANNSAGRPAFEGIAASRESEERRRAFEAALGGARALLANGRELEEKIRAAETAAVQHDVQADLDLHRARQVALEAGPKLDRLKGLTAAIQETDRLAGSLEAKAAELDEAYRSLMEASEKASDVAIKIRGYAKQSASASEEKVRAWKAESNDWINEASKALESARKRVETLEGSALPLLASKKRLEAFRSALEALDFVPSSAHHALTGARQELADGGAEREKVAPALKRLREARAKAEELLRPYADFAGVEPVLAQIRSLGAGVREAGASKAGARLKEVSALVEKFLARAQTVDPAEFDRALARAQKALSDFDDVRIAGSFASRGAERAIQRALKAYGEIKSGRPSPEEETLEVPSVVGLTSRDAREKLQDFSAVFLPADRTPPRKEDAGKVQKQSPVAGEKAKRGATVQVYVYETPDLMPFVEGLSFEGAKRELAEYGLTVVRKDGGPAPAEARVGMVKSQSPKAGEPVPKDKKVILQVFGKVGPQPEAKDPYAGAWEGTMTLKATNDDEFKDKIGESSKYSLRISRDGQGNYFRVYDDDSTLPIKIVNKKFTATQAHRDLRYVEELEWTGETLGGTVTMSGVEENSRKYLRWSVTMRRKE